MVVNTTREPRAYELMTILVPELADEDLATQIQRISTHITTATGAIKETLTDSPWGRRRLAYSVRHNSQDYRDGYYIVFHFDLEPRMMTEIERELKLDVNVMRYLLVHDDPKAGEKDTSRPEDADAATDEPTATGDQDAVPDRTPGPADVPAAAQSDPSVTAPDPVTEPSSVQAAEPAAGSAETDPVTPPETLPVAAVTEEAEVVTEPAMAPESADAPVPAVEAASASDSDDTNDATREG